MAKNNCVLKLSNLYYDELSFKRFGIKNTNEAKIEFNVKIAESTDKTEQKLFQVVLSCIVIKQEEYELKTVISGIFEVTNSSDTAQVNALLKNNAVAILMPYIRSQVSLLTAQPGTECIVLPPFNINEMMEESKEQ